MSLYQYSYSHNKSYLKAPDNHWKMMNFKGQVYEASFLEHMISRANELYTKCSRIVAKGPYASEKSFKYTSTGFFCDSEGQILYNSNRISLAEFDCIVVNENFLFFYECTLTKSSHNLSPLRKECLRKMTLLKKLFPQKKIVCTVVSDNSDTLDVFRNIDGFKTFLHVFPQIDLLDLARNAEFERISSINDSKMTSVKDLNNIMVKFDYIEAFEAFNLFVLQQSLTYIKSKVVSSNGLFPRVYWGRAKVNSLGSSFSNIRSDYAIVSINFSNINSPRIRYYFVEGNSNKVYEHTKPNKALNKMKSSRAEIIRVIDKLPIRTIAELKALESEILE